MNETMKVTMRVHDDEKAMYPINSYSDRHYGYHCGGHPYEYALSTAWDIAHSFHEANQIPGATHYSKIDLAVIPYPGKNDMYYVEDRSNKVISE